MSAYLSPLPFKGGAGGGWRATRTLLYVEEREAITGVIAPTPSPSLEREGLI